MNKILDIAKIVIGWPLSIVALFFIGQLIVSQSTSLQFEFTPINILLLLSGITFFILYYLFRSIVWFLILKEKGHHLPFYEVMYLWELSEMKRFVPGNIWSFLGRTLLFSKMNVEKKTVWFSMFYEMQFLLIACLLLSLLSLPLLFASVLANIPFQDQLINISVVFTILIVFLFGIHQRITYFQNKNHMLTRVFPFFRLQTMLLLTLFSLLYMICYGLGTYLTISAILYLPPTYLLSFIGFFVFTLLVGYLSFITPMGLGVREGMVTATLSFFVTVGSAATGAIFSRLVLIFSELLFLSFAFFWRRKELLSIKHLHAYILSFFIFLYTAYFSFASILRYENFYAGRFDLGNMDQTVWNTINGRFFQLTNPDGVETISRLAFHADFILVLLSPLYLIWSDPRMLLLTQTIILAGGAIFVYLLGKSILSNKMLGLVFALSYLLNPSIGHSNLYDFHAVTLATTFLLGAFYFLQSKKYIWYVIFLLLAGITKEQIWIIVGFFGIYTFFFHKKKLLGTTIAAFGFSMFYVLLWKLIPSARGAGHFALSYYSAFGDSPTSIAKNILLSPIQTLSTVFEKERLIYLFQLLIPFGLLSLLSPFYLLFSSVDLGINLLSNNAQLHQLYYQYTAAITPFVIIASLYGTRILRKRFPQIKTPILVIYILSCALYSAYAFGPLPGAQNPNLDMITRQKPYRFEVEKFVQSIPKNKSISASNNIGAHVSQRENIYTIPMGMESAEFVLLSLDDEYSLPSQEVQMSYVQRLKKDHAYQLVFQAGPFYAFEKKK